MPPNVTALTTATAPTAQSPSPARTVKLAPLVALTFVLLYLPLARRRRLAGTRTDIASIL